MEDPTPATTIEATYIAMEATVQVRVYGIYWYYTR